MKLSALAMSASIVAATMAMACGGSPGTGGGTVAGTTSPSAASASATRPGGGGPTATVTPSPIPSATQPGTPTTVAAAAVDTVISYYQALDDRDYAGAYAAWAGGGRASGQSYDAFREGYASTNRSALLVTGTQASGAGVDVRVDVRAVREAPGGQVVEEYRGQYRLVQEAGAWRIESATIGKVEPLPALPAALDDPSALLAAYAAALSGGNYASAYTYWDDNGRASGQSFAEFAAGFAATQKTTMVAGAPRMGGAAGSVYATIPVVVLGEQKDGGTSVFCGTYDLRRLNVPPYGELGWRLYSGDLQPIAGARPGDAQALLDNACAR